MRCVLTEQELPQWDEFVRLSPQGTLFHTTLWLNALDVPFRLFGVFRGKVLCGGFAAGLLGGRGAGAPHASITPYLGILYAPSDGKYVTRISQEKEIAVTLASFLKKKFARISFRFPPEIVDVQPFIWEEFQVGLRYTYRVSLQDLAAVWGNMDSTRRNRLIAQRNKG